MDCKRADKALMQYAEKTIKPATAAALARHVLTCETCRELYLAFDEALEGVSALTAVTENAPAGFTEKVMARVRALPKYETVPNHGIADIAIRLFWGLCAITLGLGMFGINNPEGVASLLESYPRFSGITAVFGAFGEGLRTLADRFLFTGGQIGFASPDAAVLALSALFFVGVAGALLAVLMRGEKAEA
jgi:hypothetical protein